MARAGTIWNESRIERARRSLERDLARLVQGSQFLLTRGELRFAHPQRRALLRRRFGFRSIGPEDPDVAFPRPRVEGIHRLDPTAIARKHVARLPRSLRSLLRTIGALEARGGLLVSYLLFDAAYTRELMRLGYADAEARRSEIMEFIREDPETARTGQHRTQTG